MSWQGKACTIFLLGFAGTAFYAGCSSDAVRSKVPVIDETVSAVEQVGYTVSAYRDYASGERDLDLVQLLMDLHEPTAPIGNWGRSIGEKYLGLDSDIDLVEGLQRMGDAAGPLIELLDEN